jgi:hypothetical protein
MNQLAMFVDGWNFYLSLRDAGIKEYGWCDFALLAKQQTQLHNASVNVKYFTAEDKPNPEKIGDRQKTIWWRALRCRGFQIIEGEFRPTYFEVEHQVRQDRKTWREKETDTALASHMIADCNKIEPDPDRPGARLWTPGYDEAVLLSGDSDFVPAVKILVGEPFSRRVHVLLPPNSEKAQASAQRRWKPLADYNLHVAQLTRADLANALLPQVVVDANARGERVECYKTWMSREKHERLQRLTTHPASVPGRPR